MYSVGATCVLLAHIAAMQAVESAPQLMVEFALNKFALLVNPHLFSNSHKHLVGILQRPVMLRQASKMDVRGYCWTERVDDEYKGYKGSVSFRKDVFEIPVNSKDS